MWVGGGSFHHELFISSLSNVTQRYMNIGLGKTRLNGDRMCF